MATEETPDYTALGRVARIRPQAARVHEIAENLLEVPSGPVNRRHVEAIARYGDAISAQAGLALLDLDEREEK